MADETNKPKSELFLRTVSGVILAAVALLVTWLGSYWFVALCVVCSALILLEYLKIISVPVHGGLGISSILLGTVCAINWIFGDPGVAIFLMTLGAVFLAAWESLTRRSIWVSLGIFYALLPLFALSHLRGGGFEGFVVILLLFACVWGADVFAYFSGRTIGGPKLAPAISPKKTWSGFLGGLLGASIISYLLVLAFGYQASGMFWGFVIVTAIVSQIGDLIESSLKRRFDVKDSGTLIPGHGGVLDRLDGLIIAAVFVWVGALFLVDFKFGQAPLSAALLNAILLP